MNALARFTPLVVGLAFLATGCAAPGTQPGTQSGAGQPAAGAAIGSAPSTVEAGESGASAAPSKPGTATGSKPVVSDVSALEEISIPFNKSIVISASNGGKQYLAIRKKIDFTGTEKADYTMMSLKAAPTATKNTVWIQPPFWNEGEAEYKPTCIAQTATTKLELKPCKAGDSSVEFTVSPVGDSGLVALKGKFGNLTVKDGQVNASADTSEPFDMISFSN